MLTVTWGLLFAVHLSFEAFLPQWFLLAVILLRFAGTDHICHLCFLLIVFR